MDKINISRKDIVWGYLSQVFNVGANLFILPVMFYFLSSEVLGIWYIFINIGTFATLFGLVFQSSFSRNISYAFGGATSLKEDDIDMDATVLDGPNVPLVKNLIRTMRRFYGLISVGMLLFLLVLGVPYFYHLAAILPERSEIVLSWSLYALSIAFGFYCLHFGSILQGRGYIKEYNQLIIINRLVYVVLVYAFVSNGFHIWGIALANAISAMVNYIAGNALAYKDRLRKILSSVDVSPQNLMKIIWTNTYKLTFASLLIYISTKGNLFYASLFLPLGMIAKYGLSLQVVNVLTTASLLYYFSYSPMIAQSWITRKIDMVRDIYTKSLAICLLIYISGAVCVLAFGDWGLELIRSNTTFLPTIPLALLFAVYLLDTNHALALNLLISRNKVPHLKASLWSAISIFVLIPLFVVKFGMGIYGVICAVGAVQLCYQNWKWVRVASRSLKMGYVRQIAMGARGLLNMKIKTDA